MPGQLSELPSHRFHCVLWVKAVLDLPGVKEVERQTVRLNGGEARPRCRGPGSVEGPLHSAVRGLAPANLCRPPGTLLNHLPLADVLLWALNLVSSTCVADLS